MDIFVCPKCGSHSWGTSNMNKEFDEWIGHCHGYNEEKNQKCNFTWKRTQDSKYFSKEEKTIIEISGEEDA